MTILVCILAAVSWYYEEFLYQPEPMSGLDVYFIDVGQGDAALLVCDGYTMLIDGGNKAASNLIYSFLDKSLVPPISDLLNPTLLTFSLLAAFSIVSELSCLYDSN